MLQTELGAFASLATPCCPCGRARWNVLREGMSALEGHLHADQVINADRLGTSELQLSKNALFCHSVYDFIQLFVGGSVCTNKKCRWRRSLDIKATSVDSTSFFNHFSSGNFDSISLYKHINNSARGGNDP